MRGPRATSLKSASQGSMLRSSITSAATTVQPRQRFLTTLKNWAARSGRLKVGCERWLASFQTPITLTQGQRLRNARNALSKLDTLGSTHGRLGQREFPAAPSETNGSTPYAFAPASQPSRRRRSDVRSATFQGTTSRRRFSPSAR